MKRLMKLVVAGLGAASLSLAAIGGAQADGKLQEVLARGDRKSVV